MSNLAEIVQEGGAERQRAMVVSAPQRMLELAIEKGSSLEQLQQLMDLQERHEANEARKAFVSAMAALKADPPVVVKGKHVDFQTSQGRTQYSHATLAMVCDAAIAKMSQFGLSHRWAVEQVNGGVTVHCVITHQAGHSERTSMTAPPDDSGKKNRIQQVASTVTYLERYTLMAALGMAARDMDDDAQSVEAHGERVSDDQAATLTALAEEVKADVPAFLRYLSGICKVRIEEIDDIPAKAYRDAVAALDRKRKSPTKEPK